MTVSRFLKGQISAKAPYKQSLSKLVVDVDPVQAGTPSIGATTNAPYVSRPCGNGNSEFVKIVGGTIGWGQIVNKSSIPSTNTTYGITFTNNGDGSVSVSGDANGNAYFYVLGSSGITVNVLEGHKIYVRGCPNGGSASSYMMQINNGSWNYDYGEGIIIAKGTADIKQFAIKVSNGTHLATAIKFYPLIFDLTAMFGTTIADYAYSLEQAQAGSGISWLRSYGFFTENYYPYSAAKLESVQTSGHVMRGFNAWDEVWDLGGISNSTGADYSDNTMIRAKNYIPVFPNTAYYLKCEYNLNVRYYKADKTYLSGSVQAHNTTVTTPSGAHYMRFYVASGYGTTYQNNICVNISCDRNGEYEPYWSETYPLDDVILRGIPKLADGEMYFDGDTYASDGTVTRNYGTRAYQAGDESLTDAITDGTNTVYKLTTPTTESADPYTDPIAIDPYGSESWVDAGTRDFAMPVGNETTLANIYPITGWTGANIYMGKVQGTPLETIPVTWQTEAGTVYGGTFDAMTGVLTETMENIASYNGETIGEPWLSSYDAYTPGGTPTTGAQVVYTATASTYQLTAPTISDIYPEIWADCGDVDAEYGLSALGLTAQLSLVNPFA